MLRRVLIEYFRPTETKRNAIQGLRAGPRAGSRRRGPGRRRLALEKDPAPTTSTAYDQKNRRNLPSLRSVSRERRLAGASGRGGGRGGGSPEE